MMWWWCVGSASSYPDEVLGSTPQTWLNGLALSHVLRLTLSGVPKILLYCIEYRRPTTHDPTNEESWAQMRKKPYRKKITSIESSEVYVWLVWILTTSVSLWWEWRHVRRSISLWLFFYVNLFFRFNPQMVLLSGYMYIRLICSALNPWLFIRIWMTLFLSRIWKDT